MKKIYIIFFFQIKQGNNLIAGLRATNEIPFPIQNEERFREMPIVEKIDDGIELKVSFS